MRVALVTVSDSVAQGVRADRSGPALRERCLALGWQVVSTVVTPDEPSVLQARLIELTDSGAADLILTTGGTGLGPRDITPEARHPACQRIIPGRAECLREKGTQSPPRSAPSRA